MYSVQVETFYINVNRNVTVGNLRTTNLLRLFRSCNHDINSRQSTMQGPIMHGTKYSLTLVLTSGTRIKIPWEKQLLLRFVTILRMLRFSCNYLVYLQELRPCLSVPNHRTEEERQQSDWWFTEYYTKAYLYFLCSKFLKEQINITVELLFFSITLYTFLSF